MQQEEPNKYVKELTQEKYKYGFTTDVHISAVKRKSGLPGVRLMRRKQPDTGNRSWTLERSEKLILQKKQLRE